MPGLLSTLEQRQARDPEGKRRHDSLWKHALLRDHALLARLLRIAPAEGDKHPEVVRFLHRRRQDLLPLVPWRASRRTGCRRRRGAS